ncbi:MAG: hypothetical protein V3571_01705 [Pseudodesulfovibrio sp.]
MKAALKTVLFRMKTTALLKDRLSEEPLQTSIYDETRADTRIHEQSRRAPVPELPGQEAACGHTCGHGDGEMNEFLHGDTLAPLRPCCHLLRMIRQRLSINRSDRP